MTADEYEMEYLRSMKKISKSETKPDPGGEERSLLFAPDGVRSGKEKRSGFMDRQPASIETPITSPTPKTKEENSSSGKGEREREKTSQVVVSVMSAQSAEARHVPSPRELRPILLLKRREATWLPMKERRAGGDNIMIALRDHPLSLSPFGDEGSKLQQTRRATSKREGLLEIKDLIYGSTTSHAIRRQENPCPRETTTTMAKKRADRKSSEHATETAPYHTIALRRVLTLFCQPSVSSSIILTVS
ncbi:hypothetical protein BHE74_00036095 [Ensete ventricosum]|nr:hypothetical protein BHE74_00036095 [Ensete ventricosum]